MAEKNSIVVLNIGAQRVGMARFKHKSGNLMLTGYESSEILADPAAANSRNAQIKMAVLELSQKLKVKNRVSYAVSGQSVFTRFVLLPNLDGVSKLELVSAEAQQNIPFSLDEVKWDWQELAEVDGEAEVIIAAIKSKILNDIQDAVEGAGMYTTEVDPSPAALYNAFRLGYSDVDEPVMLLDIGAKTSNVIYVDGNRLFCRSIAIGGASVTSAIAKEYNVPFTEAEAQKKANGMVALDTRHTSKMDELTAALATCIRTSLNRMPAEIARTTNFYRSQQGGGAPKRVFLAGGGANLPKITSFLQEKLRLPVEFFNPLRGVAVDKKMDLDALAQDAHMIGELVGLAARRIGKADVKLDLVPDSVEKEKELDKRKAKLVIGSSGIVLGIFVWWVFGLLMNAKLEKGRKTLEEQIGPMTEIAADMTKMLESQQVALDDVETLVQVQKSRVRWVNLLNELKVQYGSKSFWFTEITPLINFSPGQNAKTVKAKITPSTKMGDNLSPLYKNGESDLVNAIAIKGIWLKKDHKIAETTNRMLGREYSEAEINLINSGRELDEDKQPVTTTKYFSRLIQFREEGQGGKDGKLTFASFGSDKMFGKIKPEWNVEKIGSGFSFILPLAEPYTLEQNTKVKK